MFHDYDKNRMLTALSYTAASLHTAYPGSTGANEVTGGSYARVAPSLGAYSGGVRVAASMAFSVPASTVKWVGLWNGANFGACCPNGANPKEFAINTTSNVVESKAHGYAANQPIVFYGDSAPGGVTAGTTYYVINPTTDTFQVSATAGGAAITLTSQAGNGCVVSVIFEDVYASPSTHTVTSMTLGLPL